MKPSRIRVGIIGLGRSGSDIHARTLAGMSEQYTLAAASDALEERRDRTAREYGCRVYSNYREMISGENLDLIVNAAPSHLHVPLSLELLNAGFHVLCEKPLARKADEVKQLIDAAGKAGKTLAIFQQGRFRPAFAELCRVIESGVLGRIVQISIYDSHFSRKWDWQTVKAYNGGILLNTGSHLLDQALHLFGPGELPEVYCRLDSANTCGDAEDYCKLILSGEGRPLIDIEISNSHAFPTGPNYVVHGTRGGLQGRMSLIEWKYFKPEEAPPRQLQEAPLSDAKGNPVYSSQLENLTWYEESWRLSQNEAGDSAEAAFYDNLYAHLTESCPLKVEPAHVYRQTIVIERAFRQNPRFSY